MDFLICYFSIFTVFVVGVISEPRIVVCPFNFKSGESVTVNKELINDIVFPLTIPIGISGELVNATGFVKDVGMSGALNYSVKWNVLSRNPVNISFGYLQIYGKEYDINGSFPNNYSVHGSGGLELHVAGLSFVTKKATFTWRTKCFEANLGLALKKLELKISNLKDKDETILQPFIDRYLRNLSDTVLESFWDSVSDQLQPIIQKLIDTFINNR